MNFGKGLLLGIVFSILLTGFSFSQESFASNTAPIVDAGLDTTIDEGEAFLYVGSFTDPDTDTWTATVDYDDGTGTQPLLFDADKIFTIENTFENDGVYNVIVTIDDGTTTSIDTVTVTVNNITPSILVNGQYVDDSRTLIASGSFFDPGSDTWSATVDYGEGAGLVALTLDPGKSFSLSHTFANEGTFPVTITINDGTSDGIEILSVVIDDDAPVSNPGGPYVTDEGTSITLDASGSSDDGSIVSYEWDLDNDGLFDDATGVTISALFDNDSLLGPYIIGLKVTDNDSNSSISTIGVFVNNVIPIISVSPGLTTIDEGETFTGSGSFIDPGDDLFSGSVDYGDGQDVDMTLTLTPSKTFVLDHVYKQNGVYTVIVTVSDNSQEGTITDTFDVTVNNVSPTVIPGTGTALSEGDSFATSGSFSDPGEDNWIITVDYDDGSPVDSIAFNPDKTFDVGHTFADDGTYDVEVSVDDGDAITTESFTVTVTNIPPTVDAGSDGTISEGSEFSSVGFVTDPGSESFSATIDYGDGSGVMPLVINGDNSFDISHIYEDDDAFTISVSVDDDGDVISVDTALVTVNNITPSISIGSSIVDENRLYESSGFFTDPGSDTWTATVNYGDGSGNLPLVLNPDMTFDLSHSYSTNGAYSVLVEINDTADTGSLSFTVGIFVSSGGAGSGFNSPTPSSTTVTDGVVFETDDQDIWSPVTGSSDMVSWDLFTPQSWNEQTPTIGHFETFVSQKFTNKKIGIGMDMGTEGHLEMFSQVDDLKGTVDVTYPGDVDLTYADVNSFLAGETVDVSSTWQLSSSASIDGQTTGDLELLFDMGLNTFLVTETCGLGGCSDLFDVDPIDFDTTPTVLFSFDDASAVNIVPDFVTNSLIGTASEFSSIKVDPTTSSVDTVTGTVIAYDDNLFSNIAIDIDKLNTNLNCVASGFPPLPLVCPIQPLGRSLSVGESIIAYDFFDATSYIDFNADQKLTFDSDVLVKLDFDRPVAGVLGSLVDVTSDGIGVTSATYRSGDSISVTFPEGEIDPITVTPTVLLDPSQTKLHNFAEVSTISDVTMTAAFAELSIQSFQVFPPFTISYPHILSHWHCHDRVLGICYDWRSHGHTHSKSFGGVTFPGFSLPVLGPLWNSGPQGTEIKRNIISDEEFSLVGFNTVQLDSFLLDPEVPPTAVITAPPVYEGSIVVLDASKSFDVDIPEQELTYHWDLDNDGIFETESISVEFTNTADGPSTHPVSLKVCDYLNCDIDSEGVKVLNVNPTVEAGNDQEVVIHDLIELDPATFTDPGYDCTVCSTLEDFTATVNWGEANDESLIISEIPGSPGVLTQGTASGDHIYRLPGDYTVIVSVTDDDFGTSSDDFVTTVLGAQDLKNRSISFLSPYDDEKRIKKAIDAINDSLDSELWINEVYLDSQNGHMVYSEERKAVQELQQLLKDGEKKGIDTSMKAAVQDSIDLLVNADRVLTITIMLDAASATSDKSNDQSKIDEENQIAEQEFTQGDAARDAGNYDGAIQHYRQAWNHAELALKFSS